MNSLIAGRGIDKAALTAEAASPERLNRLVLRSLALRSFASANGRVRITP